MCLRFLVRDSLETFQYIWCPVSRCSRQRNAVVWNRGEVGPAPTWVCPRQGGEYAMDLSKGHLVI